MSKTTADVFLPIGDGEMLGDEPGTGHNRWHPDVSPRARCLPGDEVVFETRDALDGQIGRNSTSESILRVDLAHVHPLTGPLYIEGAQPGDMLEVEVLDIIPEYFGYTTQHGGFGFLADVFTEPYLVQWDIRDGIATSDDMPRVKIPGEPVLGIMGVAPDRELLRVATEREMAIFESGDFYDPPVDSRGAIPAGHIGQEGLRTFPPRENGGNIDIRQAGVGAKIFFPVFVEGALFSVGDAHFAQGDGEVCGQAIEMCSTARLKFRVHPGRARAEGLNDVMLSHRGARHDGPETQYVSTTGISVTPEGVNRSGDATLALRNAVLNMIGLLEREGWTMAQAYALCSVALELRASELVNVPNMLATASLPLHIFEDDCFRQFRD